MGVTINPQFLMTAIETLSLGVAAAANPVLQHSGFNRSTVKLTSTTTPAVVICSYQNYALVAGAKSIDLTALAGVEDVAQDGTGLKVQTLIFIQPAGNAAITISPGASNPYPLFGASKPIIVPANATAYDGVLTYFFPNGNPAIASGAKQIDFAGTGTQQFSLGLVLG